MVQVLEDRTAPAIITVTHLGNGSDVPGDPYAGSVREAINRANATVHFDSIVFQTGLSGIVTLTEALNPIDTQV
jgi:hypothetical protein